MRFLTRKISITNLCLIISIFTSFLFIVESKKEKSQLNNHSQFMSYFYNLKCYQKYFQKNMYSASTFCYLFTASRILSLITIILAFIIKIPQIYKIFKQKSVFGISYFGSNLQFIMYSLTVSYGIYSRLPLSVYVENFFLSIESLIIILLFFKFNKQKINLSLRVCLLIFSCLISLIFVFQMVPRQFQQISIWLQLLVFFFGRGSQLVKNYKQKSTGNLSIVTMIITIFCNISRVFSISVQTPEQLAYLLNYLLPFVMNSYILFQFYLYQAKISQSQKRIKSSKKI